MYKDRIRTKTFVAAVLANMLFIYAFSQSLDDKSANGSPSKLAEGFQEPLLVKWCSDFNITGKGDNAEWDKTEWSALTKLDPEGSEYKSKFKVLASENGIYVLFQGEDDKITTSDYKDMDKIWKGDVFEVFFQTDTQETKYFEYEVNQFEKQLLLTISNSKNGVSWIPFNGYDRNTYGTINKVEVLGGPQELDGKITSWSAEVFISYRSLGLLSFVPPKSGTLWSANFYRIDYDTGTEVKWSWSPTIEQSFHDLDKFGTIKFE
ncbi:hypothetical protein LCGC14_1414120 [marine sediment metagenome]|uniref:Carbohydrate-binding domain-containing protein n=2 Tax=root TaxID=1 RepID=A0A831QQE5_9FLAO|nr:hypothetical protein [Pricia antarctica]